MPRVLMINEFDKNGDRKGVNDEGIAALICTLKDNGITDMNCSAQTLIAATQLYFNAIQAISGELLKLITIEDFIRFQESLLNELGV